VGVGRIRALPVFLCLSAYIISFHFAFAENIDAEATAAFDISADGLNGEIANFAVICHLRNFNWVSAVNSIVLERAARDIQTLKAAGDDPSDIRAQWELIARSITLYRPPDSINCDSLQNDLLKLDELAVQGGYKTNP
jgi:hypothetical protein